VLCVACVRRCACSDVWAVRSCRGCAGRPVRVLGVCLCAAFECHVWCVACWRALFWVTRVMILPCWAGRVASYVSARARVCMVTGGRAAVARLYVCEVFSRTARM
jgi:hypothetical protein